MNELKENFEILVSDNEALHTKLEQSEQLNGELKNVVNMDTMDKKLKSEIVYDYHLLTSLNNNLEFAIETLENA